jgi:hypothetical protein
LGGELKREARAMVPITRFTKMKREEGVNHVAMKVVGSAIIVFLNLEGFFLLLCSVLVRGESLIKLKVDYYY